jgi:regulator of replication initiation timing
MAYAAVRTDLGSLLAELERLIREERELSAVRRRLHERIDIGFPNEVTAARERQISDQRLALHREIDAMRAELAPLLAERAMPLEERRRLRALGIDLG